MKKVLSMVLALMLTVCLAVPAFAVGPSSTDQLVAPDDVTVKEADAAVVETVQATADATKVLTNLGKIDTATQEVVNVIVKDIEPIGNADGTYTFELPGVAANDTVIVLHWSGSAWEYVGEGKGSKVTFGASAFSPFAFIVVQGKTSDTPSNPDTPSTNPSAPTAPQTGAPMAVPFIGISVIALAGIVAIKARKKEM